MRFIATMLIALLTLPLSGCFRGGGGLAAFMFETAVWTAILVSVTPPPPPRVVYVPAPREGYQWEPGYWTREDDEWVWVEGRWIQLYPGWRWSPTHWEQDADGKWRLLKGGWVPDEAPQ